MIFFRIGPTRLFCSMAFIIRKYFLDFSLLLKSKAEIFLVLVTRARLKFSALSSSPHSCTVTSTVARATAPQLDAFAFANRQSVGANKCDAYVFFTKAHQLSSLVQILPSSSDTKHTNTSSRLTLVAPSQAPCGHLWRRRARIARAHALICDAVLRTERMRLRQEVCRRLQSLQCAAQSSSTSFSPLHRFLLFFVSMCATS